MSAFGPKRTWLFAPHMSASDPKRTYVATSLLYHYGCTDRYSFIEICDVLLPIPETAGCFRSADRIRIVRAVNPVERAAEIHRARAERIVRIAALHVPRHIPLPRDHLRWRRPIRIFFFRGDLVRALPLEAPPADTDAVAQRRAAAFNEIKPPLCRVDDDGAWRILGVIMHCGAAEAGAIEAKDVVDALLGRAAAQHLAVGLGLGETDGTKQGGDCGHGRNMTYQHEFYPRMEMAR